MHACYSLTYFQPDSEWQLVQKHPYGFRFLNGQQLYAGGESQLSYQCPTTQVDQQHTEGKQKLKRWGAINQFVLTFLCATVHVTVYQACAFCLHTVLCREKLSGSSVQMLDAFVG